MQKSNDSILFLCRNIGTHQQKMVDILLEEKLNFTLLCTTKGLEEKYKQYLHPYFTWVANATFANWTLIIIAPILVFLDSLLFKRSKIIGHYSTTFGWAAAFGVKAKKIIIAYGSDLLVYPFRNILSRITASFGIKRANKILVDNTTGIKNAYKLGFTGKYIQTPFGIELPTSIEDLDNRAKNGEIILWVRGTEPIYNIECFIEALHILNEKTTTNWKVFLAGNGTASSKIKSRFKSDSLKEKIIFLGYVKGRNNILDLYRKSTIYISSSFSDGTSVSLLEAMAYGLTIVVSDFTNNRYWIRNGHNGYLFDPKSPKELAKILADILNSQITIGERKKQLGISQKKVQSEGSIETFKTKFKELID